MFLQRSGPFDSFVCIGQSKIFWWLWWTLAVFAKQKYFQLECEWGDIHTHYTARFCQFGIAAVSQIRNYFMLSRVITGMDDRLWADIPPQCVLLSV